MIFSINVIQMLASVLFSCLLLVVASSVSIAGVPEIPMKGKSSERTCPAKSYVQQIFENEEIEETIRLFARIGSLMDGIKSKELRILAGKPQKQFIFRFVSSGVTSIGLTDEQRIGLARKHGNVLLGHNAKPVLEVQFIEGFFLLDGEITCAQFDAVMASWEDEKVPSKSNRVLNESPDTDLPRAMSWREAWDFCEAIRAETGFFIRLPTEFEWEYAVRGPERHLFAKNNTPPIPYKKLTSSEYCAVIQGSAGAGPLPLTIARRQDTSWCGIVDLSGNLSEWCLDEYRSVLAKENEPMRNYLSSSISLKDYAPVEAARSRTFRGANFGDSGYEAAAPLRRSLRETKSSNTIGVRPALIIKVELPVVLQWWKK